MNKPIESFTTAKRKMLMEYEKKLTTHYVKLKLIAGTKLKYKNIPSDIVAAKRLLLLLKRAIKLAKMDEDYLHGKE